MGDATVDGKNGDPIQSVAEMFAKFSGELIPRLPEWEKQLAADPEQLDELERDIHKAFARGAGLVVAGLVSVAMQKKEFAERAEQTRQQFAQPLSKGTNRKMAIRLLGGVIMWVNSLYCPPSRKTSRGENTAVAGLHIEQVQFGFAKKASPALESQVSRQAALCSSFDLARDEMVRTGIDINVKTVRRVAQQCGDKLLKLRTHQLEQWRAGTLASTEELAGKRVSVQIDGGRTKLRGDLRIPTPNTEEGAAEDLVGTGAAGRSRPVAKRTFDAEWKEPKLVTIFVHNDKGKMEKKTQATIDGTFTGPDATAEIVSMHLHRLGAAKAQSITFVGDGAVWIWERIEPIIAGASIPQSVVIHEVLDNCHATHHISQALGSVELTPEKRTSTYRELRTKLRNGQWRSVVGELQELAEADSKNTVLPTEISYLSRHGEAGRLSYTYFRGQGIPLGSGSIESSIRRVINLRLKNNGTFWKAEHAEEMIQLRALVLTKRWDDRVREMRTLLRERHIDDWHWQPRSMRQKDEAQNVTTQNSA